MTFGEELDTLRLYTEIQQVRYDDRLRLKWEIRKRRSTPRYRICYCSRSSRTRSSTDWRRTRNAGEITIASRREGEGLVVTITDDGPGHQVPSPRAGAGKGIANVKTRLSQLYGDRQSFTIVEAPDGGTRVTIRLPFMRTQRAAAADQDAGAPATGRSLVGSGSNA